MGQLYKIKNKTGIKWGVDYIDPAGRRVRNMISPYKEVAEKVLKKIEIDIAEGKYLDVRKREPVLFEDFAQRFFEAHICLQNKSVRDQKYLLDGLVVYFRGKCLHQITPLFIRQRMAERLKTVKPATVNKELTMIKSMFNRAIEWEVLQGANPAQGVKKLPENNERCRWLTEEEQERLLLHCQGIIRMIVLVALKTGLRWGEIVNLKWQQAPMSNYVDFENDTFVIHQSLTKNKRSRYVPLAPSVKQALMDFPQHSESGYIFINPKTGKLFDSIKKSFRTAVRKAGIVDFRFHDLRHVAASQLVRNGTDLYVVQKLLGHATPRMTQRYAHLRDDQLKEAIYGLDEPKNQTFGRNLADSPVVE